MKKEILIIASEEDTHSAVVAWSLRKRGHNVTFLDTRLAMQTQGNSVRIQNFSANEIYVLGKSNFYSAWLRRVPKVKSFNDKTNPDDFEYISRENDRYIDNLFELSAKSETRWLNDKKGCIWGEMKTEQLDACRQLNVSFPDTLISNDPSMVRKFITEHGTVAVKPLDVYTWEREDESRLMTYTNTLSTNQLATIGDDEILACPVIYQKLVKKTCDLRVAYVNGNYFACKIVNPNQDCIDFRPFQTDDTLLFEPYSPPEEIKNSLKKLCKHFNLTYASSDFCIDEDGKIYFLDLNPGGAFLFIEYHGAGSITAHIASFLSGVAPEVFLGLHDYNDEMSKELQVHA